MSGFDFSALHDVLNVSQLMQIQLQRPEPSGGLRKHVTVVTEGAQKGLICTMSGCKCDCSSLARQLPFRRALSLMSLLK